MERVLSRAVLAAAAAGATLLAASTTTIAAPAAGGANERGASAEHARIVGHWTAERRAAAIPRELVIDERGLGYLRKPDGSLQPYGHSIAALAKDGPQERAKPVGENTPPTIENLSPANNATIGASATFSAKVTDASGIRSVSIRVGPSGGQQQSFNASAGANDVYSVNLSGFTNGSWTWSVVAKDRANNTAMSSTLSFTVGTAGGGGGGVITNSPWTASSTVREAAGRIYFEMPSNSRRTRWAGYVCSGTVVSEDTPGRSIIQTAAHCVYDDAYKAFARNVLFIPNQQASGTATDTNCSNDYYGCWSPNFGVVDVDWTTRTFPDNVKWDYAYYVVNDANGHAGNGGGAGVALDATVGSIAVSFDNPTPPSSGDTRTYALGYSYSEDPKFMHCAEPLASLDSANWWLESCGLSGGSSGGPWMLPFDGGEGTLISVNSWGYTNQPGMAGPKMNTTSASCVFANAKNGALFPTKPPDGDAGYTPGCP